MTEWLWTFYNEGLGTSLCFRKTATEHIKGPTSKIPKPGFPPLSSGMVLRKAGAKHIKGSPLKSKTRISAVT
ncbi:hypothetical protein HMPREF9104_00166 [Lentilactobacillus kisonensis F0435]|uniref:Uncharacterized protein n=1 Tax=Lentilactobacillus kisonensis F0435 TaxID=797516 RepID=H1LC53_9LACO|nr:hypothetical protein HMPREF9104_00166 [Lentilactobacillus kisonensis F0435]